MNAPAAIQGDFVDLRFIKGRKVCQIVIEIPIEAGATFVAAFGTPNPAISVPVAVARIHLQKDTPDISENETSPQSAGGHARASALEPERRSEIARTAAKKRWGDISLAQQAGIICGEGAFTKFLNENYPSEIQNMLGSGPAEPADLLRALCGVESRSELDANQEAATIFRNIETKYRAWMIAA
jgi:hypothetical protein